ncbi:MAG: Gfo/Idh/MocA family oxidoreductase [Candidatus Hydrogenedentes bacterium]|nr:Gfo/Idh/MocA family oxidoreductase [Candidatus Hydrogenedentota bacterium]
MSETHDKSSLTRRQFTKLGATASFAMLARGAYAQTGGEKLKVGLLGCGSRGTGAAMNMLEGNENVEIAALADVFDDKIVSTRSTLEERAAGGIFKGSVNIADDHCFVGLDAYTKILATDIDILIEGTLPYCRPTHVAAAIDAGKHVFTEKPISSEPAGVRVMIEASKKAQEKKLSLVSGTQRRHDPGYIANIEKIRNGDLGEIKALRVYWCGGLPFVHDRQEGWSDLEYCIRNWYAYCWVAGDNIVEQHIHNIDVGNWIMDGHPTSVYASGGRTWKPLEPRYGDIWDHFDCDYEFDNGVHMFSMSRHWDGTDDGIFEQAWGTKGTFFSRTDVPPAEVSPYVQEHIDLVKSITGEGPYLNEGVRVAESTLTAIMGRMSANTGRRIKWEEALNADLNLVPAELSFDKEYPLGPIPCPVQKN